MTSAEITPVATLSPASGGTSKRILHVLSHTDPRYGGLSAAVPALAASLEEQGGFDTRLAAFVLPGEAIAPIALRQDQTSFWPTSRLGWRLHREERGRFSKLVRDADALHIHGLWEQSTAVACHTAHSLGKPYVLSAHGMLEPWALAAKRLKKRIYAALLERAHVSGAACLHALTRAEARQYRAFGARSPIAIVPNAVQVPPSRSAEPFWERFPALQGKRLVLFLSRLHPKKGLDLLLSSWAVIAHEFADAHLVLAGPDSDGMQAELITLATKSGISNRLSFAGMLHGALKWSALAAAEAYVLPSYSEGLSMALLEAMGAGLPVIATTACNMPEITASGAGWEIDASEPALTTALRLFLQNTPEVNAAKGSRGEALIAERYSPKTVAAQMAALYHFVLDGVPSAELDVLDRGAR